MEIPDVSKFNLPAKEVKKSFPATGRPDWLPPAKGRATGSTNIASRRASKKLEALGFDPIEKMIELYHKLERDVYNLEYDEMGLPKTKVPALALSQLKASQQKCISELMRYGYARVTEGVEISTQAIKPISIMLADPSLPFDTSLEGTVKPDLLRIEQQEEEGAFKGDDE